MVGVNEATPVPQIVCVKVALVIAGMGLTVTTIVNGAPTQKVVEGPVGITVYVTLTGAVVVLNGRSFIIPVPPLPLLPVHE